MENNTNPGGGDASFRVLFEKASIPILVVNQDGRIEFANACADSLFGYTRGQLDGNTVEQLIPGDPQRPSFSSLQEYLVEAEKIPEGASVELHAQKSNGDVFPVRISLASYEHNGERLAVAFIVDNTEKLPAGQAGEPTSDIEQVVQQRTNELYAALDREREMNALKSRFVSMASHEFRNPLSIVLSSLTLIEQYGATKGDEMVQKHITRIRTSVRNLNNILNDFLSLDKLEQGNVEMEQQTFDLLEFVGEVLDEVQVVKKTGQQVVVIHSGKYEVTLDQKKLRYIMVNLLSNALKYSAEDTEIKVTSNVSGRTALITVSDHGIGIPDEDQKYLFNKFFRARNTGSIQGTGLGLTIVKRYVELMDGRLSFVSKAGEGTTFTVELPLPG